MNRRKAEACEQYNAIKRECDTTQELLSRLLEICSIQMDVVDKLDCKLFKEYSKKFIAVMQFFSLTKQKMLEWNFDLEEFLNQHSLPEHDLIEISNVDILRKTSFGTKTLSANNDVDARSVSVHMFNDDTSSLNCSPNGSFTSSEFYSTSSKLENTNLSNIANEYDMLDNADIFSVLNSLPVMTIEEKCTKNIVENIEVPRTKCELENCIASNIKLSENELEINKVLRIKEKSLESMMECIEEPQIKFELENCISSNTTFLENEKLLVDIDEKLNEKLTIEEKSSKSISDSIEVSRTKCELENCIASSINLLESEKPLVNTDTKLAINKVLRMKEKSLKSMIECIEEPQINFELEHCISCNTTFLENEKLQVDIDKKFNEKLTIEEKSSKSILDSIEVSRTKCELENCIASSINLLESEKQLVNTDTKLAINKVFAVEEKSLKSAAESAEMPQIKCELTNCVAPNIKCLEIGKLLVNSDNKHDINQTGVFNDILIENSVPIDNNEITLAVKQIDESTFKKRLSSIPDREEPKVGDICLIGCVETPAEVYIQVVDKNLRFIDNIPDQLSTFYQNSVFVPISKIHNRTTYGNYYAAYIEDCWYRIEVINWMLRDEKDVIIQLIDYGHKYKVPYEELYPLANEFYVPPKMAQKCHLPYLYPPNSTKFNRLEKWSEEVMIGILNIFGDLNSSRSLFSLQHVYYSEERKSYEIDLLNIYNTDQTTTIGQQLIENGLAEQVFDDESEVIRNKTFINQIRMAQGLNGISDGMTQEEILDEYFKHHVETEVDNLHEAVTSYNPRDEAETCKNLRRDGTCYKGSRCRFRHVPLTSGYTTDKVPVYDKAFEENTLPRAGEVITLSISCVKNIENFYAHIINKNRRNNNKTLSGLIQIMNDPIRTDGYKKLKYPPSLSEIVIVKHWERWYRGQIRYVEIPENNVEGKVEVYLVDYGDVIIAPLSDLRMILPEFLQLSFQAIECRLHNVKQKPGINADDGRMHFESNYLGQPLEAKIVASVNHLEVLLENENGEDIGELLIGDGFAELKTEHCFPCDESVLVD